MLLARLRPSSATEEIKASKHNVKFPQCAEKKQVREFFTWRKTECSFDSACSQVSRLLQKSVKYEIISNFVVSLLLNFAILHKEKPFKGFKAKMFFSVKVVFEAFSFGLFFFLKEENFT